jgi:hypothetical protein
MTNNPVRFQHKVISASVDFALQDFNISPVAAPHMAEELAEKEVNQRLLAKARLCGMRQNGAFAGIAECGFECLHHPRVLMDGMARNTLPAGVKSSPEEGFHNDIGRTVNFYPFLG